MNTPMRLPRGIGSAIALVVAMVACEATPAGVVDGTLAVGTWGGDNAGVIVLDTLVHVHVGCTLGDIPGRVSIDAMGRFTASGSYNLRAYPIAVGPTMPAQFTGQVVGSRLTFAIVVTDTVANQVTTVGPATVEFGKEPQMGVCPICRVPGDRSRIMGWAINSVIRRL